MTKLRPSKVRSVKIIDPRFVKRVGYPLGVDDMRGVAEQTLVNAGILASKVWAGQKRSKDETSRGD